VVLLDLAEAADLGPDVGRVEDVGEVEALGLPVVDGLPRLEPIDAADHLLDGAEAELRHDLAHFLGDERMKFTTCSGLPVNFSRRRGSCVATPTGQVLRWQTRIMMQPVATSGAVAKPNSSAPSSAAMTTSRPVLSWPSVSTAMREREVVEHERLVRLGEAELPGQAGVLDRGLRRGAGAAVVAGDEHDVRVRLGDAGGDGADADLGDELHADARVRLAFFRSWMSSARSSME
jgi:hypothetical protein